MAITSPLDLAPLVWLNPTAGSYTGSNLTSLANSGTVGGSFTVTGTIAKSTAIGNFTTLRMDNISKRLNLTFAIASGVMTVVYWGKFASTTLNGIMGKGWPGDSDAKAFYANAGSGETIAFAKGCCSVDPAHAPALDATAGGINDTSFHTLYWQMGATNALFRDNSGQTITTNAAGAMPSTGSVSWNFGSTDPTSEPANADIGGILVFDFALTSTQRNDLDTWTQGQAAGTATASLAAIDATDTTAIAVGLTSFATLAAPDAKDTAAIAAGLTSFATLAATDPQDVAAIAVGLTSFAALAATDAVDTASFAVNSGAAPVVIANIGGGFRHIDRVTREELEGLEEEAKPPSRKMRKRLAVVAKQAKPRPMNDDDEEEAMILLLAA